MRISVVQRGRPDDRGFIAILIRISKGAGTTAYLHPSLPLSVPPSHFDKKKRIIVKDPLAQRKNDFLAKMVQDINAFAIENPDISARELVKAFKGHISHDKGKTLLLAIDEFIQGSQSRLAYSRIKVYKSLVWHLNNYDEEIYIGRITDDDLSSFASYLLHTGKITSNSTVLKLLQALKAVLSWHRKKGADVPLVSYSIRPNKKEIIYLTDEELMQMYHFTFPEELQYTADLFCFSAFTGIRYSDLMDLAPSQLKNGVIHIQQIKTGDLALTPLNKYSKEIWDKYKGRFPFVHNYILNKKLKKIGKLVELNSGEKRVRLLGNKRKVEVMAKWELLNFHAARATFIMHHLSKGLPERAIMKMTGQTNTASFAHYVRFSVDVLKEMSAKSWE